jgi:hypothetical protein
VGADWLQQSKADQVRHMACDLLDVVYLLSAWR